MPSLRRIILLMILLLISAAACLAQTEPEQTQWLSDIVIPAGHEVEEATCFFCSIRVEGKLGEATTQWGDIVVSGTITGGATAIGGGVRLTDGGQVQGDTVSVFGDTVLGANAKIGGDAVASIGTIRLGPGATIAKSSVPVPLFIVSMLPPRWRFVAVLWIMGIVISLPLAYLSLISLKSSRMERIYEAMKYRRWRTLILGTIALTVFIVTLDVGGDSKYDDSIELTTLIVMALLMAPGYTAISLKFGKRCRMGTKVAILVGTLALVTLQVIPVVGWLLSALLMIVCLGSLFSLKDWARQSEQEQALSPTG